MTTQKAKKPQTSGNVDGFQNTSRQHYFIRKPPYSNRLNLNGQNLIVCTGLGGWDRAKSQTWFSGCKVVLPFGDDPAAYTWSMTAGLDVIIAGFGNLEPIGTIAKLAGLLLVAGATLVIYVPERGSITRIEAARKEAA